MKSRSRVAAATPNKAREIITRRSWRIAAASLEQQAGLKYKDFNKFQRHSMEGTVHLEPHRTMEDRVTKRMKCAMSTWNSRTASQHYRPRAPNKCGQDTPAVDAQKLVS